LDVNEDFGQIDTGEETIRGAAKGLWGVDEPRFREYLRLMHRWSEYWPRGFSLAMQPARLNPFLLGKMGIFWSSAWEITPTLDDPLRDFEIGTFYFPPLTTATSPYATGKSAPSVGCPGTTYYVTSTAVKDGTVDICIDWLMYITTPRADEMITQAPQGIQVPPSIKGVKPHPRVADLMKILERPYAVMRVPWAFGTESSSHVGRIYDWYLKNEISLDEAIEKIKFRWLSGVEETMWRNQYGAKESRYDVREWGLTPEQIDEWDLQKWIDKIEADELKDWVDGQLKDLRKWAAAVGVEDLIDAEGGVNVKVLKKRIDKLDPETVQEWRNLTKVVEDEGA